jgi:hypothetical protein
MHFLDDQFQADGRVAAVPILGAMPVFSTMPPHKPVPFATSGLAPATLVEGDAGPVAAKDIRPGMELLTRGAGPRPVLWSGVSRNVVSATGESPVRIRRGALDPEAALPANALLCAPGQLVLLRHALNDLLFGAELVLARAADLTHLEGVEMVARADAAWVHLLFDSHEMIRAEGMWVESLRPEMDKIEQNDPFAAQDIYDVLPRLRYAHGASAYVRRHPVLNAREALLLTRD